MTWTLEWSGPAVDDMCRLDRQVARRIRDAVLHLAETGQGDVRKLTGQGSEMRLRVGDWRVRFEFLHGTGTIEVLRVLRRSCAYRE